MEAAALKTHEIKYAFDKCKICDGPIKMLEKNTVDGLALAECRNCGFLFVRLIPTSRMWAEDNIEKIGAYYASHYSQTPSKFHYGLSKIIGYLKLTGKDNTVTSSRLLDVGCGNGEFLLICRDKGFNITGVEQSQSAIQLCRRRGLSNIHATDLDDMSDTFDVITLFDVAEHLEDPKSFFKKIFRRLNSDGIIYIETPRRSIIDAYINILGIITPIRNNRLSREHVQLYSDKSLRTLLEDSGFDIISFETKLSLSWSNKKPYFFNLGIKSDAAAALLEKITNVAIRLKVLGHNKAIVLAKKNEG